MHCYKQLSIVTCFHFILDLHPSRFFVYHICYTMSNALFSRKEWQKWIRTEREGRARERDNQKFWQFDRNRQAIVTENRGYPRRCWYRPLCGPRRDGRPVSNRPGGRISAEESRRCRISEENKRIERKREKKKNIKHRVRSIQNQISLTSQSQKDEKKKKKKRFYAAEYFFFFFFSLTSSSPNTPLFSYGDNPSA